MKSFLLIALTFLFLLPAKAQTDTARLKQIIQNKIDGEAFSGTVLMAREGKPLLQLSTGLQQFDGKKAITQDTRFAIASITKMVTALLVLQLVEEGKLQLTDRLSTLLPAYNFPKGDSITIHHLLLHISGLPEEPESIYQRSLTEDGFVRAVLATGPPQTFEQFHYNNLDYVLLGMIVGKKRGMSWKQVVQQRIIRKLGLKNTGVLEGNKLPSDLARGYHITEDRKALADPPIRLGNFFAAGALYSTAADLLKLDQALYGNILINEESKRRLYTSYPQYQYTGYSVWTYPYPFAEGNPRIMERRGGILGANSVLVRFLDSRQTLIILSNNDAFHPDSFGDRNNLREALIIEMARQDAGRTK